MTTTTFPPDHTNMLGLHNILLIAPPPSSSSFHHPYQQTNISSSHQIANNINDQCNISSNPDSWTALKRYHQESSFATKDALSLYEGNENSNNTSTRVCRDCGNRAKKECEFRRCRTCCKSRGYDCATHVKSTWVPAARRRDRHGGDAAAGGSTGSSSGGRKRPREDLTNTSNSFSTSNNNAAAFNFDNNSNYQDASFKRSLPSQIRLPAAFRCVRVTAFNGGQAEVAYKATVNISGHVFKGFLYDQGIDEKNLFPCISKMPSSGRNRDSTSPIVDPPDAYPPSGSQRLLEDNE